MMAQGDAVTLLKGLYQMTTEDDNKGGKPLMAAKGIQIALAALTGTAARAAKAATATSLVNSVPGARRSKRRRASG